MTDTYRFRCSVERVVDGDTYDVKMPVFFDIWTKKRLRLSNLDTAEIYGVKHTSEEYKLGKEQMEFAKSWLAEHNGSEYPFTVITSDDTGKYGRYIGVIEHTESGETLNAALTEEYPEIDEAILSPSSFETEMFGLVND